MNALGFPILSVLLAVPLAAALWILFAPGSEAGRAQNARVIALGATLIDFALGILLWLNFDSSTAAFQFRSEEHTSELQSLMRISYAVFCLKKKNKQKQKH